MHLTRLAVMLLIGGAVVTPLATIWALNTLFGLGIPYTFATWLACLLLLALLGRAGVSATFKRQ